MAHLMLAFLMVGGTTEIELDWQTFSIRFYGPVDLARDTLYRIELEESLESLLSDVPLDAERSLWDVVRRSRDAQNYFQTALAYPQVVSTCYSTSGEVQNEYAISLLGPFIESFIPYSTQQPSLFNTSPSDTLKTSEELNFPIPNTGFVIDARGIGFQPCVFPRLLDPQGNILLEAGNVDRNVLFDRGYVHYAYSPREALQSRELGLNPLRLVAERAAGDNHCNLVLSNSDVERIVASPLNQRLLSECRVIIIIDPQ